MPASERGGGEEGSRPQWSPKGTRSTSRGRGVDLGTPTNTASGGRWAAAGRPGRPRSRSTLAWPFCRAPAQCSRHVLSARRLSLAWFLRFPPPAMDLSRLSICDDPSAHFSALSRTRASAFGASPYSLQHNRLDITNAQTQILHNGERSLVCPSFPVCAGYTH